MTTKEEMEGVYALLSLVADPKAAKERLDQISTTHQKNMEAFAAAHALALDAEKKRAVDMVDLAAERKSVEERLATTEATLMAHRLEVENFKKSSAAEKQKLHDSQTSLNEQRAAIEADRIKTLEHGRHLSEREQKLNSDEAAAAIAVSTALKTQSDAAALKKTYEDRLAALRSAMAETN
jgi:hypothetical protein